MAFLRIEGLDVSTLVDNFDVKDDSIESYNRAVDDSLQGVTYSIKHQISFVTEPLTASDARSLEGWLRGRKHQWSFDRIDSATTRFTKFSSDGGLNLASASTSSTVAPMFGSYALQLNTSAVTATATAMFGSEGDWSVSVFNRPATSTTWVSYAVRSRAGTVEAYASGVSTGTLGFLNVTASSGFLRVTLSGRTSSGTVAGTSGTALFDQLAIYPFALTDAMLLCVATPSFGLPSSGGAQPPYVRVVGDALIEADVNATGSGEPGPIDCKATVESFSVQPTVLNGTFAYNSRQLRVRLDQR